MRPPISSIPPEHRSLYRKRLNGFHCAPTEDALTVNLVESHLVRQACFWPLPRKLRAVQWPARCRASYAELGEQVASKGIGSQLFRTESKFKQALNDYSWRFSREWILLRVDWLKQMGSEMEGFVAGWEFSRGYSIFYGLGNRFSYEYRFDFWE